jgi:hypothetical protein
MPLEEFEKYKEAITKTAKAESLKAYREVVRAYGVENK